MRPEFWSGKRVLVTGHTGFKGSWLSLCLQRFGAEVAGYALPPSTVPSLFEGARVADGMASIHGDVRDLDSLRRCLREQRPEIVLHLAGQPIVRRSYRDPIETFGTNVMGTANVLEAVRHTPSVAAVVVVTSDKCYENREWVWGYREVERLGGSDPYSASKACAELVASAYTRSFFSGEEGPRVATARAGNVIGGGDWSEDRLIPDMIRALLAGRPLSVRNPGATRPWQHVLDPLKGYLTLAERLYEGDRTACEAWNFGPHRRDPQPVSAIVEMLAALWGEDARWEVITAEQPHEDCLLQLDCSKAQARLGWKCQLSLRTTLSWIVSWHRATAGGGDQRRVCERQIDSFFGTGLRLPPYPMLLDALA